MHTHGFTGYEKNGLHGKMIVKVKCKGKYLDGYTFEKTMITFSLLHIFFVEKVFYLYLSKIYGINLGSRTNEIKCVPC